MSDDLTERLRHQQRTEHRQTIQWLDQWSTWRSGGAARLLEADWKLRQEAADRIAELEAELERERNLSHNLNVQNCHLMNQAAEGAGHE